MPGNRVDLLENGEQYFPAVLEAIARARRDIIIETFILFEDKVGLELQRALIQAAGRGVSVDVLVDGFGSPSLSDAFVARLVGAGVRLRSFDPRSPLLGLFRTNVFRRMHRKIVVVDADVAFVGGINFSAEHLLDFGPEAKQDYAARIRGPIVARIHAFAREQIRSHKPPGLPCPPAPAGDADVMFVTRDNHLHRDDIERQYRAAIRSARREVTIANAYFFPGYRLLKTLRQAARRGVRVRLILQGQPDMKIVKTAATLLHGHLVPHGVEIYEYCRRPLHGKVAVVDEGWATIGSCNLDPLSLSLNLEANVMVRDSAFIAELRGNLEHLMADHCKRVEVHDSEPQGVWRTLLHTLAYHFTRHFPAWAGWLPAHKPSLKPLEPQGLAANTKPALAETETETERGDTHHAPRTRAAR